MENYGELLAKPILPLTGDFVAIR